MRTHLSCNNTVGGSNIVWKVHRGFNNVSSKNIFRISEKCIVQAFKALTVTVLEPSFQQNLFADLKLWCTAQTLKGPWVSLYWQAIISVNIVSWRELYWQWLISSPEVTSKFSLLSIPLQCHCVTNRPTTKGR